MNKVMGNKKTIALFVLPAFIIYAIFALAPIFYKIKKETGYTFVDILNGIRLMCAASLIKTGEKISDVCEKTGFNDQHYFSQLFKKTFGCTPSNYRNENGENFPGLYEILNSKSGNGK